MPARYAIYFIPEPETALAARGSTLLGRDGETGGIIPQAVLPGFSRERLRSLTEDARRYGLHATLKAPFFLKPGRTEQDLLDAAARFVPGRRAFTVPRLEVARIGSFFALIPSRETPEEREAVERINALAADAASFFDSFRAAPSEQEIARRNPQKLSEHQRELLAAWGYPYVFDEYRFHLTLTDGIHDHEDARVMAENLDVYFENVCREPMPVSGVCVCKQETDVPAAKNVEQARQEMTGVFMPVKREAFTVA